MKAKQYRMEYSYSAASRITTRVMPKTELLKFLNDVLSQNPDRELSVKIMPVQ